jgi:hypothetical protein
MRDLQKKYAQSLGLDATLGHGPMSIFQNFNEVTSLAHHLHQFVTMRKTMVTKNKGQLTLRKQLNILSN